MTTTIHLTLNNCHVYVNPQWRIYEPFNEATLTLGKSYKTHFKYHSLHFLLSEALCILNEAQGKQCVKSFRGAAVAYQGEKDDIMRFGQFASSTTDEDVAKTFADWKNCFKVNTCFVKAEKEVLIPPYEVFKIAKVNKNKVLEEKDKNIKSECEIVYELESTKTTK
ncbi:unnamed protein product, partial [Coregonus sp. 'balchen']